jgi:pantoate--beta-alanine ligase
MEIIRINRILQDTDITSSLRGRSIGLVPTMGALHDGHLSLVRSSRMENDITVVSIFTNPTQFGPDEDFEAYPRDLDGDMEKLRNAGVDILFAPDTGQMYPEGFSTRIEMNGIFDKLCGAFRPGHMSGVATVVAKLLNIARPTRAYFGQKDYQQHLVVSRFAKDLNIPVEIVMCPTLRDQDGLAMSSRNQYLNTGQRVAAAAIYGSLSRAEETLKKGGVSINDVNRLLFDSLSSEPLITEVQYAAVYDPITLDALDEFKGRALLAVAVKLGNIRLIDNILL